jgi:hypothetical protein
VGKKSVGKRFFSEEKNQKTFFCWWLAPRLGVLAPWNKSLFGSFSSEKEHLSSFTDL